MNISNPLILLTSITLLFSCKKQEAKKAMPDGYPYYEKAYVHLDNGKTDSAFLVFNIAKNIFIEAKDSLNTANCLIQMAIIQSDKRDYFGAQETSLEAISYLDQKKPEHFVYLSSNYNNLGITTYQLNEYDRALEFYNLALKYSLDSANNAVYLNNIGKTYHDKKEYQKAIAVFEKAIHSTSIKDVELARALTNMANSRRRLFKNYNPLPSFLEALHIRESAKDYWGMNSSYAHLSDYYSTVRTDSALYYANQMLQVSTRVKSADDQILSLSKLIRLSSPDSSKFYFEKYKSLEDSVQFARSSAKNQFAVIRYEVEKNKAENLELQKDNAEKDYRVSRQKILTTSIFLLSVLLVFGAIFWYKKRKQRLELETDAQIKANRLKTSRKVHDVVANGIYRVMAEIENKDEIDRESVLDQLEEVYEKSRDISYETEDHVLIEEDFSTKISNLLTSFATEDLIVLTAGSSPELWKDVDQKIKNELTHVLQELMVNMRKHSQASEVIVRFEKSSESLSIYYSDNGVGFANDSVKGNGLANTENRIENLFGEIIFATERESGFKVTIFIPFS
ncbi:tetratricopeptide repeat protein [Sphingobacterium hungaricum]|uniref:histidine kinase n=1 Tax=Sphingobacterium hungaricum TaxID=2082723 RepID=A0A928YPE3_9SPHI|nr:tetratricopeptide repeat protein [Sphingobacterium hungaricum]MBE8712392.1 ATP-binding protein [Sphingobacterium hungaricum]